MSVALRTILAACLVVVVPAIAAAQDRAAARTLFDEGTRLVEQGDFAGACPRFAASLEAEVKLGTKLALASCYETIGRTASAWAEFRDAAALANRAGETEAAREKFARDHARDLEAKLVRLT